MGKCTKCRQEYDQDAVNATCCDHCGMPLVAPTQQATNTGMDAIAEMDKAVRCLALELPEAVYDDVKRRWDAVKGVL